MSEFRTQRARDLAARDPAAGALIRRAVAARAAMPLTDDQIATLRRALPPIETPENPAA